MTKKICLIAVLLCMMPGTAFAMHIMEGFLPPVWAAVWYVAMIPFVVVGLSSIKKLIQEDPSNKMLLGFVGAFAFVLSALKLPSVTGSCSHPTGVGLGAILFGPWVMSVIGMIVLLFQALLLAHGGLTTLGANTFSMAIVGPFISYATYKLAKKMGASRSVAVFLAAALGDLMTYVVTSFQLAIAFPAEVGGFAASFTKFIGIFALTQVPLAISEGLLTVIVVNLLSAYDSSVLTGISKKEAYK